MSVARIGKGSSGRPGRHQSGGGGGGSKTVITPEDLTFQGYVRFPGGIGENSMYYSNPALAPRTVGSDTHVFIWGDYDPGSGDHPLLEFKLPTATPNTDVTASPAATLIKDWGLVRAGHVITNDSDNPNTLGGLYWDESRNAVWWTYGDGYVPVYHHPTLCCTVLNDAAGTFTTYGPWRPDAATSSMVRGALLPLPDAFVTANTPGKPVGIMGHMNSGVDSCPFGPNLYAMELFDPATKLADTASGDTPSVAAISLIQHDVNHKKTRDTRYAQCHWVSQYNCSLGYNITDATTDWAGPDAAVGENDTCKWAVWIDTPTKHGILFGGQLTRTPDDYVSDKDPNGLLHMWYGNSEHAAISGPGFDDFACCHNQADPWWGTTGPASGFRQPMGWIYNPDDLVGTAAGTTNPWALTPTTDAFQWKDLAPGSLLDLAPPTSNTDKSTTPPDAFGTGAFFDSVTNRLYIPWKGDRYTVSETALRPLMMVFEVAT